MSSLPSYQSHGVARQAVSIPAPYLPGDGVNIQVVNSRYDWPHPSDSIQTAPSALTQVYRCNREIPRSVSRLRLETCLRLGLRPRLGDQLRYLSDICTDDVHRYRLLFSLLIKSEHLYGACALIYWRAARLK
ncbi:hypothetical protein J6590_076450 [Homalodisca vitripennis]|nr:hypothetical protein J6590_076450 [Homalodisca vitripennis]